MAENQAPEPESLDKHLLAESDRGCVLVAHAAIDEALEGMLTTALSVLSIRHSPLAQMTNHLQKKVDASLLKKRNIVEVPVDSNEALNSGPSIKILFDSSQGPMATTWAKIEMANALGLLTTEVYNDLHTIRRIRNQCAHKIATIDFLSEELHGHVKKLSKYSSYAKIVPRYNLKPADGSHPSNAELESLKVIKFPKAAFAWCTRRILSYLSMLEDFLKSKKAE
jgi:DNA-binding MltR family transcriptional regulator